MRRLVLVVLGLAALAIAAYRHRSIERWEQELAIGGHADDRHPR